MPSPEGDHASLYPLPDQWSSTIKLDGLPAQPTTYPNIWRVGGLRSGGPVMAAVLAIVGYMVLAVGATLLASTLLNGPMRELEGGAQVAVMVLENVVTMILLVPLSFLLSRVVGQKGRWLSSVAGGLRWGWLLQCAGVGAVVIAAYIMLTASRNTDESLGLEPASWAFLVPLVLLAPLQAAGVEYLLRGVVNRGAATLTRSPAVGAVLGAVVSTSVYLLMHIVVLVSAGDVWGGAVWVLLGFLLSWVAWRTGGLEACIVLSSVHILLFSLPVAITGMGWSDEGGGATAFLVQLIPVILAGAIIVLLARARGVQRTTVAELSLSAVPRSTS